MCSGIPMLKCPGDRSCLCYYSKEEVDGEIGNGECAFKVMDPQGIDSKPFCRKYNRFVEEEGEDDEENEDSVEIPLEIPKHILADFNRKYPNPDVMCFGMIAYHPTESSIKIEGFMVPYIPFDILKEIRRILDDPNRNVHAIHRISELLMKYNI